MPSNRFILEQLKITVYLVFILGLLESSCSVEHPTGLPLIIDADTANEVDDLYAIVRALHADELNVMAITSAQFHTSPLATDSTVYESQKINEDIISLMDRDDVVLPLGANGPMTAPTSPASSEASAYIINTAREHSPEDPIHVAVLGSCTNMATAIVEAPDIIPNVRVHYIGFWHDTLTQVFDLKEFNSGNDTFAVQVLLDAEGLDFDVMTATTCQHLVLTKEEVDQHLKGKGGISDYLVNRWETYTRWWTQEDPEKQEWIMWDVAIIEALIHPELAEKRPFKAPSNTPSRVIDAYIDIDVSTMIYNFWMSVAPES